MYKFKIQSPCSRRQRTEQFQETLSPHSMLLHEGEETGVCQFQSSASDSERSFVTLNVICVIAFDNSKYSAPTMWGFAACGHPPAFLLGGQQ